MKRPQLPVPSRRGLVVGAWAVALLVVALIMWMLWLLFNLQDSTEDSRADRDRLASDVAEQGTLLAEQQAQLDKANARLVEAGERPVNVPPEIVEGIPGKPGPAPTFAQVLSAVETYCSGLVCVGPAGADGRAGAPGEDGRDGQDGAPGSDGRDGAPGADGEDGQDGAMGPAGPKGDKGDKGDKGEQGEPGPPQSCASEFVCASELDAALASYYTKGEVVSLLRALGCTVSTDAGNPNQTFTCTITGKP